MKSKRYQVHISTRHPLLISLMDALGGTRRRSGYVASALEQLLAIEVWKQMAEQIVASASNNIIAETNSSETSQGLPLLVGEKQKSLPDGQEVSRNRMSFDNF